MLFRTANLEEVNAIDRDVRIDVCIRFAERITSTATPSMCGERSLLSSEYS